MNQNNGLFTARIAVVGATGNLGAALAGRFAKVGFPVIVGSRVVEAAQAKAAAIGHGAVGMTNSQAVEKCDITIVTVPYAAHDATLREIASYASGKIVVDTTVPLQPPKVMRVQLPPEGSAAVRAQSILGSTVRVVSAFHNVAAHKLAAGTGLNCDVLVFSDDKASRGVVVGLASAIGLRGIEGGPLANSAAAEALTSVLIYINKTYQVDGAGIAITGSLSQPT